MISGIKNELSDLNQVKKDVLSGITVAFSSRCQKAIAFSFIAGVNPMMGLWSAVVVGLITAAFGATRNDLWSDGSDCDWRRKPFDG